MGLLQLMNRDWAIRYETYIALNDIVRSHKEGPKLDLKSIEAKILNGNNPVKGREPYQVIENIAVIPVKGVLAKAPSAFERIFYGATGMIEIKNNINHALNNPLIENILLDVDSPGGTVDGTMEFADFIYENRDNKKIVAFSDGMIASAAYWISSAASEIYISSKTVNVGSIGVIATHYDYSGWNEKYGVKATEIYAGKYKASGSPEKPLSEDDLDYIQSRIDYLYTLFVDAVARNRGVTVETVLSNMADARIFIGQEAIDAGLVDGVSTFDGVIDKLKSGNTAGAAGFRGQNKNITVSITGKNTADDALKRMQDNLQSASGVDAEGQLKTNQENDMLTIEALKKEFAENPDLYKAVKKDILTENVKDEQVIKNEAAKAEMERIQGVYAQLIPGHENIVTEMMFDGKSTAGDAAIRINTEHKKALAAAQKDFENDLGSGLEHVETPEEGAGASSGNSKPLEDQAKETWEKSAEIRAEFNDNFASYMAYLKAQKKGSVKIQNKEAGK